MADPDVDREEAVSEGLAEEDDPSIIKRKCSGKHLFPAAFFINFGYADCFLQFLCSKKIMKLF